MSNCVSLCVCGALLGALACGDDDTTPGPVDASTSDSGASPTDGGPGVDAGGDASPMEDASTGFDSGEAMDAGGATIPSLSGDVYVGHFLTPYAVHGFDAERNPIATPFEPGGPTGDLLAFGDVVATTREGGSEVYAVDATTLMPIAGSPYATANLSTALAHDPIRQRLYVYCVGTLGDPSMSNVTVYDTSSAPWSEVAGSPFDIDVAGLEIAVDPTTGNLVGLSLGTVWMVETTGFTHVAGSPIETEPGRGSDLAIDPIRRRFYWAERNVGNQVVHEHDLDTFSELGTAMFAGSAIGEIALNLRNGDLWAVDFGNSTLHRMTTNPLTAAEACTGGCGIGLTETGLALDYDRDRLYILHIPDAENPDTGPGSMSVWDVSAMPPTELTMGARISLQTYPIRATIR